MFDDLEDDMDCRVVHLEVDRWSEVLQINRNIRMSFPRRQASKIKKLCKQHGIDINILNSDLNE